MRASRLVRLCLLVLLAAPAALEPRGLAPAASSQSPTVLTILSRSGTSRVPLTAVGGREYVGVDELAAIFGLIAREDRLAAGLTLTVEGRDILLTADQSVVSVAGRLVSLPAPPVRQGGRWLVPLDFLPRALGPALSQRLDLRAASRLLVAGDLRVPRVVARVQSGAGGVQVTFEISPPVPAHVDAAGGELTVRFEADALDLAIPALPAQTFLLSLAPGDVPGTVRLIPGPRFAVHRATSVPVDAATSRLVVDLLPAAAAGPAPPTGPPAPTGSPEGPPALPVAAPASDLRTVVIDPGHGGEELGTLGPRGTREKDVTLGVARRLRTLIESRLGLRVLLTRDEDRTMGLDERAAVANNNRADVFISLHVNAAATPGMRGAEVYYLSLDRAVQEAQRVARSEDRLPVLGGGTRALDLILWEAAQARHLEHSAVLAGFVQQALAARVPVSPTPIQQAPFRVLVGANMPAVLVEMGYLSNPQQEQALASPAFQDQLAEALYDAIVAFRAHVARAGLAPAADRRPPPR